MKINKKIIEKTRKYAKRLYAKSKFVCHDWDHIAFVTNHAKYIAKKEGMDIQIAEMGALLHDFGRTNEKKGIEHAVTSAEMAEKYLKSLKLDKEVIKHILDTIRHHSGTNIFNAETREALAVYDADKLSVIHPSGLVPVAIWIKHEEPKAKSEEVYDLYIKACKKRIKRMQTKTGKILAKKYFNQTKEFRKHYEAMRKKCK